MRNLDDVSGPWRGLSTQDSLRITETLRFTFHAGQVLGEGSDQDGLFRMMGGYSSDGSVRMTRIYHECAYGPEGIGIPYDYRGIWDGGIISGRWCVVGYPEEGGPFEMWPESEEDIENLQIHLNFETIPKGNSELVTASTDSFR